MKEEIISSQDNIYQIAEILRNLRNKKEENTKDIALDPTIKSVDYFATIYASKEKNYFIQFAVGSDPKGLMLEASSIHKDKHRLSREKVNWLLKNEWFSPGKTEDNYYKIVSIFSEKDLYMTAADIVTTFIMVYDFIPTDMLKVDMGETENLLNPKKFPFVKRAKFYLKTLLSVLSDMIRVD